MVYYVRIKDVHAEMSVGGFAGLEYNGGIKVYALKITLTYASKTYSFNDLVFFLIRTFPNTTRV